MPLERCPWDRASTRPGRRRSSGGYLGKGDKVIYLKAEDPLKTVPAVEEIAAQSFQKGVFRLGSSNLLLPVTCAAFQSEGGRMATSAKKASSSLQALCTKRSRSNWHAEPKLRLRPWVPCPRDPSSEGHDGRKSPSEKSAYTMPSSPHQKMRQGGSIK